MQRKSENNNSGVLSIIPSIVRYGYFNNFMLCFMVSNLFFFWA